MIAVPFVDLARQHEPLSAELRAAFDRLLGSSAFTLGEEVQRFEEEFAEYCGVSHCVGLASGTAALTIMLRAAGVGSGDEVIVPAHTFIATALAVIHAGATPVCVDVERSTGLIDPAAVAAAITPATAAILVVHLYGQVCAMDSLRELADRHHLLLLEDAAQAQGATYRGLRAGSLADAAAFSFYPSKNLGALGDAGAICTDDAELAASARKWRDLGRDTGSIHTLPGYNERLDALQAAMLRVKLRHVDRWNEERREIAAAYRERLEAVTLLEESAHSPCAYHLFPIKVDGRDSLAAELGAAGILTGVHYPSTLSDQPAWPELREATPIPNARDWTTRELSLPIFPGMSGREVGLVAAHVNRWTEGRPPRRGPTSRRVRPISSAASPISSAATGPSSAFDLLDLSTSAGPPGGPSGIGSE